MLWKTEKSHHQNEAGYMELSCGDKTILFDANDYPLIAGRKWTIGNHGYATCGAGKDQVLMHRLLADVKDGESVDHINMNKLDNRRCNLRRCNAQENGYNKPAQSNNKCGYRGVCMSPTGRWFAQIVQNGSAIYLGNYDTAEEAANAYDSAAAILAGDFAWRNLPEIPLRETIFAELEGIRRSRWLSEDEIGQIKCMFDEGMKTKEIASAMRRSVDTVRRILNNKTYQNGRTRPCRPVTKREQVMKRHARWLPPAKIGDILELSAAGYPTVDIAWAVGCSISAVRRLENGQTYRRERVGYDATITSGHRDF